MQDSDLWLLSSSPSMKTFWPLQQRSKFSLEVMRNVSEAEPQGLRVCLIVLRWYIPSQEKAVLRHRWNLLWPHYWFLSLPALLLLYVIFVLNILLFHRTVTAVTTPWKTLFWYIMDWHHKYLFKHEDLHQQRSHLWLAGRTSALFSRFDSFLLFLERLLLARLLCIQCFCFWSDSLSDSIEEEKNDSWELRDKSEEYEVLFLLPSSTETENQRCEILYLFQFVLFQIVWIVTRLMVSEINDWSTHWYRQCK